MIETAPRPPGTTPEAAALFRAVADLLAWCDRLERIARAGARPEPSPPEVPPADADGS